MYLFFSMSAPSAHPHQIFYDTLPCSPAFFIPILHDHGHIRLPVWLGSVEDNNAQRYSPVGNNFVKDISNYHYTWKKILQ